MNSKLEYLIYLINITKEFSVNDKYSDVKDFLLEKIKELEDIHNQYLYEGKSNINLSIDPYGEEDWEDNNIDIEKVEHLAREVDNMLQYCDYYHN